MNEQTPAQALEILKQVVAHDQLRFLNLKEHSAVQQAILVLDRHISPPAAPAEPLSVVPKQE